MNLIIKLLSTLSLIWVLFLLVFTQSLDHTPLEESTYYQQMLKLFANAKFQESTSENWQTAWAKVNITPNEPLPMAGYGNRKGKPFTSIHDSLYVRVVSLTNGLDTVNLVSLDMLIVPPTVVKLLSPKTQKESYFSATHSHNSIGGWYNTLAGLVFAGKYHPSVETTLASNIEKAINMAQMHFAKSTLVYSQDLDKDDIRNRLIATSKKVDPFIRSIEFKQEKNTAILTTYAAHSTVLNSATMQLSRDYPGVLVDTLEKTQYDFALFMAGAVGSMGPIEKGSNDFEEVRNQANAVAQHILNKNIKETLLLPQLASLNIELPMRKPAPRLNKHLSLRPWVFYYLFGNEKVAIKAVKIGNSLMVGLPCDFSGELMSDLESYASKKGLNLIVTSFNGGYVGYITADEHYHKDKYETQAMNWYGPYNGRYFSEVIKNVVDLVTK